MELLDAVKGRRSIRKYEDKPIAHETIEKIVESARFYPSWKNSGLARFYVIEGKENIKKYCDSSISDFSFNVGTVENAAAVMVIAFVKGRSGFDRDGSFSTPKEDRWEMFDCGIAAQTFALCCHEEGIGTCILGYFDEVKTKEFLGLGDDMGIGCVIPMGYSSETPNAPRRKEVKDILVFA
ncbi:MAG: nitroreductase family protein [Clostridia bacterium]|nr:nitroreductase family protein [Clostridia bacterium]